MIIDFTHSTLGKDGPVVHRLGLSATYRPGVKAVYRAADMGINMFFAFSIDSQMINALRDILRGNREKYVLATGAYNYGFRYQNLQQALEKRLRQFRTDYIDIFLFLGITKEKHFTPRILDELRNLKENGKVRYIGVSSHHRKLAGRLAEEGKLDVLMIRYNAAHRGAEQDIFPYLDSFQPGLISYTATRWTYLLRRPKHWDEREELPTGGMCYRFVLSNPHVDVCLTAPRKESELVENMEALDLGPLSEDEMAFMRRFGDAVYEERKWFM